MTANVVLVVVIMVILLLIGAWLLRGLMRRNDDKLPPTNMEAFHTIRSHEDFERAKREGQPILALVYAPWCGHCKTFLPQFKQAALLIQQQQAQHNKVAMALIDAEAFPKIHDMVKIEGYPTCVQMWEGGEFTAHQPTERSAKAVEQLANAMAGAQQQGGDVATPGGV